MLIYAPDGYEDRIPMRITSNAVPMYLGDTNAHIEANYGKEVLEASKIPFGNGYEYTDDLYFGSGLHTPIEIFNL